MAKRVLLQERALVLLRQLEAQKRSNPVAFALHGGEKRIERFKFSQAWEEAPLWEREKASEVLSRIYDYTPGWRNGKQKHDRSVSMAYWQCLAGKVTQQGSKSKASQKQAPPQAGAEELND